MKSATFSILRRLWPLTWHQHTLERPFPPRSQETNGHEANVREDIVSTRSSFSTISSHQFSGVSPELKGSKKRPKIAKTNKPSPSIASDNDTPAESDSLFIPSGNARRQNTSSTGKGGCKSQKANTAESADHPSISVDKSPPAKKVPVKPRQGSKTSKSTTVPGNHAGSILDTLGTFPGLVTPTASSNTDSDNWIGATTTESVETSIPAQKEPETSVPAQKEPKTSKPRKSQSQKARSGDGRDGTIIAGIDL